MPQRVVYRAKYFKEGDFYIGLAPELGVSSFGETLDEARQSLQEAVEAFLEECQDMGTLVEVMEEGSGNPSLRLYNGEEQAWGLS